MAKVSRRKAAKAYPEHGIAKGDQYYYAKIKTGPRSSRTLRSLKPFSRSQLTSSEYLSALFSWEDERDKLSSMDDAQALADTIRDLGDAQGEKFDNMPDGLQQGPTGSMLEERRDACEAAAGEIEDILSDWESAKESWDDEIAQYRTDLSAHEKSDQDYNAWVYSETPDGPEPDIEPEPDLPDNTLALDAGEYKFDDEDFVTSVHEVSVDG